jgi:hypothetical protein
MESFFKTNKAWSFQAEVPNIPFFAVECVLANEPQHCNGTWQRHNQAVCFGKR